MKPEISAIKEKMFYALSVISIFTAKKNKVNILCINFIIFTRGIWILNLQNYHLCINQPNFFFFFFFAQQLNFQSLTYKFPDFFRMGTFIDSTHMKL